MPRVNDMPRLECVIGHMLIWTKDRQVVTFRYRPAVSCGAGIVSGERAGAGLWLYATPTLPSVVPSDGPLRQLAAISSAFRPAEIG